MKKQVKKKAERIKQGFADKILNEAFRQIMQAADNQGLVVNFVGQVDIMDPEKGCEFVDDTVMAFGPKKCVKLILTDMRKIVSDAPGDFVSI